MAGKGVASRNESECKCERRSKRSCVLKAAGEQIGGSDCPAAGGLAVQESLLDSGPNLTLGCILPHDRQWSLLGETGVALPLPSHFLHPGSNAPPSQHHRRLQE